MHQNKKMIFYFSKIQEVVCSFFFAKFEINLKNYLSDKTIGKNQNCLQIDRKNVSGYQWDTQNIVVPKYVLFLTLRPNSYLVHELTEKFVKQGYNKKYVDQEFAKVKTRDKNKLLKEK